MNVSQADIRHRKRVGWVLFGLAIVLAVGWVIAIVVSWQHIVDSHNRLGYVLGDLGMVVPLSFASWYGLTHGRPWAPGVFLFLAGAAAFDSLHFGVYLIQEKFLSIPMAIYIALIILVLGVLAWLALWENRRLTARMAM
jgi:hypothetical protein